MATLNEVTQAEFDTAESTLISLVRAAYPSLDLRRGTVLRDILLRPAAAIYAMNSDNWDEIQSMLSLIALEENADTVDPSAVDAILSNFLVERNAGAKAAGQVLIRVDSARTYSLASGFRFATLDGLIFVTTRSYTAKVDADTASGEIELHLSDDGTYYYFIVNVVADAEGAQYNIEQGTALDTVSALFGFVSAEAYASFASGLDEESIQEVIERLPSAISYRALESRAAIDSKLRNEFEDSTIQIEQLSVQGYGDSAQLRDKHNPMGFAVGSRVDVYARTFTTPNVVTLQKTGTLIAPNTYQLTIARTDAPGFYAIKSITEMDAVVSAGNIGIPAIGSYAFLDVRAADGLQGTFHDIDSDNSVIETAFSVYQKSTVTVQGVPYTTPTRTFKVQVYTAPGLSDIQDFVDDTDTRNLEADYIIRCPLICLVSVDAKIYYDLRYPVDTDQLKIDLHNYINGRSFVRRLTRSELANILLVGGVTRVDLGCAGMTLQGVIRDAAGTVHTLQGDVLDIGQITDHTKLLTQNTTVFAIELSNITLEAVGE